jgi:hypothetical protein
MPIAMNRTVAAGALLLTLACRPNQLRNDGLAPESAGRITFRNQSAIPIQVYLVGETREWLLGRLEPLQTGQLLLPAWTGETTPASVALVVISGWSRTLDANHHPGRVRSLNEPTERLNGGIWIFVNGQLLGPSRGESRSRPVPEPLREQYVVRAAYFYVDVTAARLNEISELSTRESSLRT